MRPQKYTFEQRKEWCEAYLKGEHVPTPLGARRATFIRELRDWARKYKRFGPDSIDPSAKRKDYSITLILAAASLVASGEMSTKEAARQFGVKDKRTVRAWARRYREGGAEALKSMRRRMPDAEKMHGGGTSLEDRRIGKTVEAIRAGGCLSKKLEGLGRRAGVEPRNNEKAEAVRQTREQFPKAKLGELLSIAKLAKSTYLYCLKHADKDAKNADLMAEIAAIFESSKRRYGVRRVAAALRAGGTKISNAKVNRLMRKMGLRPRMPKRHYRSYKGGAGKSPQLLLVECVGKDGAVHHKSDFSCSRPDEKWTTDVSQFNFPWGKCYLSPIKDMFTGEIISYDLSLHPNMAQISRMLKRAFDSHPDLRGLIFHSDQGWQYMNKKYAAKLAARGICQSMSRKGNCYDNSIMESFFGVMKNEMYYGLEDTYKSFAEFKKAVDEYIAWYNKERIREGCGFKSPILFRAEWNKTRQSVQ